MYWFLRSCNTNLTSHIHGTIIIKIVFYLPATYDVSKPEEVDTLATFPAKVPLALNGRFWKNWSDTWSLTASETKKAVRMFQVRFATYAVYNYWPKLITSKKTTHTYLIVEVIPRTSLGAFTILYCTNACSVHTTHWTHSYRCRKFTSERISRTPIMKRMLTRQKYRYCSTSIKRPITNKTTRIFHYL